MRDKLSHRRRVMLTALCSSLILSALMSNPAQAALRGVNSTECQRVSVPVQVGSQSGPIVGTLCVPPRATTLQVLVHGWTYGKYYFDFPYQRDKYSYVQAANRAGYGTLSIDRLGAGKSFHPLSVFDTFNADVRTVHEVIRAARSTIGGGHSFNRIVGAGHSLGSLLLAAEAGRYRDLNAMVLTGFTHMPNYVNDLTQVIGPSVDYPATADPKFADSGLDIGYATRMPGTTKKLYYTPNADPKVIRIDKNLKQTQTLVELSDIATYSLLNVDRTLNIPVLTVTGQRDQVLCGMATADCSSSRSIAAYERKWYGPSARVEAYAVPNAGHNVQLQQNSESTTSRMLQFVGEYVGNGTGALGSSPGIRPKQKSYPKSELTPDERAIALTFTKLVKPMFGNVSDASGVIPGLGTQDDDPSHVGDKLHIIGNTADRLVGTLPQDILDGQLVPR